MVLRFKARVDLYEKKELGRYYVDEQHIIRTFDTDGYLVWITRNTISIINKPNSKAFYEITLVFNNPLDMLLFAEALRRVVIDHVLEIIKIDTPGDEYKLAAFLKREQEWLRLRQQYQRVIP